jgi:hypothetical protein
MKRPVSIIWLLFLLLVGFQPAWHEAMAVPADEMDEIYRLVDDKNYGKVMELLEQFLRKHPKDPRARFLKGLILTELGRRQDAIAVFLDLTRDYPELPEPFNNLAVLYAEQGNFKEAKASLLNAIKTHPSYATAHENLGDIYAKMASQAYGRALQLNQSNLAAQTKLALIKKLFFFPEDRHTKETENRNTKDAPPESQTLEPQTTEPPVIMAALDPSTARQPPEPTPKAVPKPPNGHERSQPDLMAAKTDPPSPPVEPVTLPPAPEPRPEPPPEVHKPTPPPPAPEPQQEPPPEVHKPPAPPPPAIRPVANNSATRKPEEPDPGIREQPMPRDRTTGNETRTTRNPGNLGQTRVIIEQTVRQWADAWSAKNAHRYVGYYSSAFKTPDGRTRAAWAKERRTRIQQPTWIAVRLTDLQVNLLSDTLAQVTFLQRYESNVFQDTVYKILFLQNENGQWKIIQELADG